MRVFRREYSILALMICVNVTASFASPLGIKELLRFDFDKFQHTQTYITT
jgi:hypothetical protein